MIRLIILSTCFMVVFSNYEPPQYRSIVKSSVLPTIPSTNYGIPDASTRITLPKISSVYGPPQTKYVPPSSEYGTPRKPSTDYGVPKVSSAYGVPQVKDVFSAYEVPKKLASDYSVPSTKYGGPHETYELPTKPSFKYGAPKEASLEYGLPKELSADYGVPLARARKPFKTYGLPDFRSSGYL